MMYSRKDYVKAMLLEAQYSQHRTDAWMAKQIQVSVRTWSRLIHERHTDEWPLKYIRTLCWALNITNERFAAGLTGK